ncbi:MAG TPA: hypothetical protein DIT07_16930 [Sphingobacteriaceae bacterium]|nr:hypothetical protein [Sphingobacteriaceae bacterium]
MMEDKNLDELFRKSLDEEEIPFEEAHWRDMKKKLEQNSKRRRDIFLWASLGGAAAMFLMTMAWWFTQSVSIEPDKISKNKPEVKAENRDKAVEADPLAKTADIIRKQNIDTKTSYSNITAKPVPAIKSQAQENVAVVKPAEETVAVNNTEKENAVVTVSNNIIPQTNNTSSPEEKNIIVLQDDNSLNKKTDNPGITVTKRGFRPSLILTVTAAPDLSAVNSFTTVKKGLSGGLLATVSLSPKFGITTGAVLARKVYQTGYDNYRPVTNYVFPVSPSTVDADCRVLDIPLNLNYTVWDNGDNKIGFSAGASSYFMIEEKYDFKYQSYSPGVRYPRHYEVRNLNKHFMGIGNIAVSYERKLNKNAGIALQPFVKLPLTEIGFGNVKLMSAGVSANLNINISEITGKKP